MAIRKYDKYFVSYERSQREMEAGGENWAIANLSEKTHPELKGCFPYSASWVNPDSFFYKMFMPDGKYTWYAGHPPHIHKYAQVLFHIGTNPEDPSDLGGEVEMYMGPELERHVFTRSTVIFCPANFIHGPWKPVRTWRPWIFLTVEQGLEVTEKRYWQLLPEDVVVKINKNAFPEHGY
jgi:hypothetical protein